MELWHVLNRGVDGRDLFLDSGDYVRFIHNLYQFNDSAPALQSIRRSAPDSHVGFRKPNIQQEERDLLVNIHGWVLMKNHYHLVLSGRVEDGITLFLRKLNIGYANYFNERYDRNGTLFQGRTKKILVERHEHALYLLHYIHLNPLDHLKGARDWRVRNKGSIKSIREALEYLDTYRWSSYPDYCKRKNFPSILTTSFFTGMLGDPRKTMKEYLHDAEYDDELSRLTIEK